MALTFNHSDITFSILFCFRLHHADKKCELLMEIHTLCTKTVFLTYKYALLFKSGILYNKITHMICSVGCCEC